jgi:hypothetical protein
MNLPIIFHFNEYLYRMKYVWIFSVIFVFGCGQTAESDPAEIDKKEVDSGDPYEGLSMKEAVELHIRRELSIAANEPIEYQIYQEKCDDDDSSDAVIAVNLFSKAMDEAMKSGKVAKYAETGFMGKFNYIIYRDGMTGAFSPAMPVPSSAKGKLAVSFEAILSDGQRDILVDYRIRNACYRNIYTVKNSRPLQVHQVKLFDGMGDRNMEVYVVAYEKGEISNAKDVVLYKGTSTNPTFKSPDEVYNYVPKITKTNEVHERWFFNPSDMKYYMMKQ